MIPVERENEELAALGLENCAFCRRPTSFWYVEKDVAVCLQCAEKANPEDVPDKATWCKREQIAADSDILGAIASGEIRKVESAFSAQ